LDPVAPRPMVTSLLGFVYVPQTDTSSSYLAVDSTHTAVGRFRSLVRRSGTRCLTISEIRRVVLTVLSSFLRHSCLVFTKCDQRIRGFLKCYALYKSTFYLLTYFTYLLPYSSASIFFIIQNISSDNKQHVLHQLLPDRTQPTYNLRSRKHACSLTVKHSVTANEFITRMLYKDIY